MKSAVLASVVCFVVAACSSFEAAEPPGSTSGGRPGSSGGAGADAGPPPANEDCLDGRDDNGDGSGDCADPSCAPYVHCVAAPDAMPGWEGYATLVTAGDCPPEIPAGEDAWQADGAKPACAKCECQANVDCSGDVSVTESPFAGCSQGTLAASFSGTSCAPIPVPAGGAAKYWAVPANGTSSCQVVETGATTLPATKHQPVRVCTGAKLGVGCPAGQVCAKRSSTPLCVARPVTAGADTTCPTAFPVAHVVAPKSADPDVAFTDDRACSPCTCTSTKGGRCNRVLSLFSDANCGTLAATAQSGLCINAVCNGGCDSGRMEATAVPGTCAASGGAASGGVTLAVNGRQYCCDQ